MRPKLIFIFLSLIVFLAFILRLYRINNPLADWHSWRQADTAAVGRHFFNYGIDLLHPRYDDLSSIPSGLENPEGYRMVEFPILGALQALVFNFLPFFSFETTCRLISIFFSLLTIIFLFLIVSEISNLNLALLSAFVYAILPYNIFYGRVILPEPMMLAMVLASIYFFLKAIKSQNSNFKIKKQNLKIKTFLFFLASLFCLSTSILIKPFVLFISLPTIFYLWFRQFIKTKKKFYFFVGFLIYWFVALMPFFWWRRWISQFPEGIPANMWLLNGDGIRFKGAWFYWLFAERIAKLILGYWGVLFLGLGLLGFLEGFYLFWLVGVLFYLIVVATGNVRHDYYQVLITPLICIFVAQGMFFLLQQGKKIFKRNLCFMILILGFLFMEAFSWYQVRDFFNINHPEIVEAGKMLEKISQPEDKVIAPYGGDTAFLYQTNRKGWPIGGNLEDKVRRGARYYVSVKADEETQSLMGRCPVYISNFPNFWIFDLRNCSPSL